MKYNSFIRNEIRSAKIEVKLIFRLRPGKFFARNEVRFLKASEKWERSICENQAFAVLHQMQAGRSPIIKKDGGEMLVAMILDRPLAEVPSLVCNPPKLVEEILQIMSDKQSHPVIEGMVNPDVRHNLPVSEFETATSVNSSSGQTDLPQNSTQPKEHYGEYQYPCPRE